jgi:hypothetical protein
VIPSEVIPLHDLRYLVENVKEDYGWLSRIMTYLGLRSLVYLDVVYAI